MINKILKVGDSAAVTIPKKVLREMRLRIGDSVFVQYSPEDRRVHLTPVATVDPEIARLTKGFIARYRSALFALAKK